MPYVLYFCLLLDDLCAFFDDFISIGSASPQIDAAQVVDTHKHEIAGISWQDLFFEIQEHFIFIKQLGQRMI